MNPGSPRTDSTASFRSVGRMVTGWIVLYASDAMQCKCDVLRGKNTPVHKYG